MDRHLTEEEQGKIINFGALNYDSARMAAILEINISEINKLMKDKKSEYYKLYAKGGAISEYLLDVKVFEMAKSGDLKALFKYEQDKINRK